VVERLEPAMERLASPGACRPIRRYAVTPIDSYLDTRWIYSTDTEGNRFELKDRHGWAGATRRGLVRAGEASAPRPVACGHSG
jgi:hypothetical protein